MLAVRLFTRDHLRTRLTLALLIVLPAIFVLASASVLGEFARALGGGLKGEAASALGAGWSAAFIAGSLGFFQISSARAADRRLALAGFGTVRVVGARFVSSLLLAVLAGVVSLAALAMAKGVVHPWHTFAAIAAFALVYLAVGTIVGSLIVDDLEGSMAVAFVFLLDVFSGPGMTSSRTPGLNISRDAADVLIGAALGQPTSAADWVGMTASIAVALIVAVGTFAFVARSRL